MKLLRRDAVDTEETLSALGPDAWPQTPDAEALRALLDQAAAAVHAAARPARDRRDRPVLGRRDPAHGQALAVQAGRPTWTRSRPAPCGRRSIERLGDAIAHYEQALALPLPDKLPLPLTVHRHNGEPCPRCGTTLEAVFYEDYVMCYCPVCQTDGKVLKDRRLSRLLK